MGRRIWIGVVVVLLIVVAVVAVLLMLRQGEPAIDSNTVELSAGCNDIVDVSVLREDKKLELCRDLIDSRRRELEERGFVPGDCRVDSFEVVHRTHPCNTSIGAG